MRPIRAMDGVRNCGKSIYPPVLPFNFFAKRRHEKRGQFCLFFGHMFNIAGRTFETDADLYIGQKRIAKKNYADDEWF